RPCRSRLGGGLSASALCCGRRRSERWPKRCFRAASSLPRSSAFSARSRAISTSSSRTIACSVATSSGSGESGVRVEASMPDETPPGQAGSAASRSGGRKAFEAAQAGQVDAVEDHLELANAQLDAAGIAGGRGEVVATGLQALTPQAQAVPAPVQDLDAVGTAISKNEQVARQGGRLQASAGERGQTVKP